jgi:hypothetical protein
MNARRIAVAAAVSVFLLVVFGCKSGRKAQPGEAGEAEKAGTTMLTSSALRQSVEDASQRLATARCEQEMACSDLTSWTRDTNKAECVDRVKAETAKELSPDACPAGIGSEGLIHCVAAIERTGCGDPVARLMTLEDCKTSKLCVAPPGR